MTNPFRFGGPLHWIRVKRTSTGANAKGQLVVSFETVVRKWHPGLWFYLLRRVRLRVRRTA